MLEIQARSDLFKEHYKIWGRSMLDRKYEEIHMHAYIHTHIDMI